MCTALDPSMSIECSGYTFLSDFDSANLARVELAPKNNNPTGTNTAGKNSPAEDLPDFEFRLWTKPDCAGTEYENGNRTWFYFGVKGGVPHALVRLNIVNLNRQTKMYSQGMAPVFHIVPGHTDWERIKDKPTFMVEDEDFVLSFKFRTPENTQATTYFAFTYPYSYKDLQDYLDVLDKRFGCVHGESCHSADEIYFHRECVCYSLEGRRVELITISSHHNITSEREARLKHLFPIHDVPRPFHFHEKKVIFISARVHPGETPSSFVLNGLMNLLLSCEDPIAVLLRKMYVFKFIPMLNPDGVARGHYRTDTRGVNLNRVYQAPSLQLHPSVYSAWALIKYYHCGKERYEKYDAENEKTEEKVCFQELKNELLLDSTDSEMQGIKKESLEISHERSRMLVIEGQVSGLTLEEKQGMNHSSKTTLTQNDSNEGNRESAYKQETETSALNAICNTVVQNIFTKCDLPGSGFKHSLSVLKDFPGTCFLPRKHQKETRNLSGGYMNSTLRDSLSDAMHCDPYTEASFEGGEVRKSQQKCTQSGSSVRNKRYTLTSESSGLFLYIDLHGHASKKGIFMYGNYFQKPEERIECMLLPKIISLNSQNFHFTACNFTERNMYLRDKRDGLSREGSGRVAVWKATGLIRSYTLECNYNTGRLVNNLPPCVKDARTYFQNALLAVPPKYTPQVFEEVGRALAVSILDLTGSNPWSRIPHSEFHTVSGIREWLRANCIPEQSCMPKVHSQLQARHSSSNIQIAGVPAVSIVTSSATVPGSKLHHTSTRRNSGFSRRRRLVPIVTRNSDSKITFTKMTPNLNIGALYNSGVKAAKAEVKSCMAISERKENVSDFQASSDAQSSLSKKTTNAFPKPKENIGPSTIQMYPGISKKLKNLPSCANVLKRVLVVQSKYTSVESSVLCSKASKKSIAVDRLQTNPSLSRKKKVKKGIAVAMAVNPNMIKCQSPVVCSFSSDSANDQQISQITGYKTSNSLDEPCSSGVNNVQEAKDLTNSNILCQGPKRLKISPLKLSKISVNRGGANKDENLVVTKVAAKGQIKDFNKQKSVIPSGLISVDSGKSCMSTNKQEMVVPAKSKEGTLYQSSKRNKIKKSYTPTYTGKNNSCLVKSFLVSSPQNSSSNRLKSSFRGEGQEKTKKPPAQLVPLKIFQNKSSCEKNPFVLSLNVATSYGKFKNVSNEVMKSTISEKEKRTFTQT